MAFGRARHATHERRPARHRGRVEADQTLVRSRGRAREHGARWLGVRLHVGDERETSPATPRCERSAWREATKVKLARRWPVAVGEEAGLVCRRQALHDET